MTTGLISLHEVPPSTDEQWAEALALYGADRHSTSSSSARSIRSVSPFPSSNPLIHPNGLSTGRGLNVLTAHLTDETSSDAPASASLAPTYTPGKIPPPFSSPLSVSTRNGDDGRKSTDSRDSEDLHSPPEMVATWDPALDGLFKSQPGIGRGITETTRLLAVDVTKDRPVDASGIDPIEAPETGRATMCDLEGKKDWSAEEERERLRQYWESKGYLPNPILGEVARMQKKRALMNLGFLDADADAAMERKRVMSKYAHMASTVFGTTLGAVAILDCTKSNTVMANIDEPIHIMPIADSICGHALVQPKLQCFAAADMSKDWRFASNPVVIRLAQKFFACAPLRYRWKDTDIDLGALFVLSEEPRYTFDARDQDILMNLANMLMYQLTTLQSSLLSKRSSSMYEQSIQFLRRSVVPHTPQPEKSEKSKKPKSTKDRSAKTGLKPRPIHSEINGLRAVSPMPNGRASPAGSGVSEEPVMTTKNGPRDSKRAKSAAQSSERALFEDCAATLRKILKADSVTLVDLADYALYVRRSADAPKLKQDKQTKETILASFLSGKPWPTEYEPIVHYIPKTSEPGLKVLGADAESEMTSHFNRPGSEDVMRDFVQHWTQTRHFWWDREDQEDELSVRLMQCMPEAALTTLATTFITYDGRPRFAMFACWKKAPSSFGDSQMAGLPFTWIVCGCAMAALSVRTTRALGQSQISYSNLQAHELRTPLHQILAVTQLLRSAMNDLADTPQQRTYDGGCQTTMEQIRDLLPLLDAIDTSGKTLHGIVDNILSFLDLKGKDSMTSSNAPSLLNSPTGATQTLEIMFEELIHEAFEEDKRARLANGQPSSHVETVLEILTDGLGEDVIEDSGGALRRALGKIFSNAYKFIDGEGCVEIVVEDAENDTAPEGFEDLTLTRRVRIKIKDDGKGMEAEFVRDKLGEPWAKEDQYATGSGLSVHLAFRIIDLMGGTMEVSSAPDQGCIVIIELSLPRRQSSSPVSPASTLPPSPDLRLLSTPSLSRRDSDMSEIKNLPISGTRSSRKVAIVGFHDPGPRLSGRIRLAKALERQYAGFGCEIVSLPEADLVIADGLVEESERSGLDLVGGTPATEIVFLVNDDHEPHPEVVVTMVEFGKQVRRLAKPVTASIVRESLFPGQNKNFQIEPSPVRPSSARHSSSSRSAGGDRDIPSPPIVPRSASISQVLDGHSTSPSSPKILRGSQTNRAPTPGPDSKLKPHFDDVLDSKENHAASQQPVQAMSTSAGSTLCPIVARLSQLWKPKNMAVEDAVACLSLGDYANSHRRTSLTRTPSLASGSSYQASSNASSEPGTPKAGSEADPTELADRDADFDEPRQKIREAQREAFEPEEEEPELEKLKVLVVEDNRINRKILVKILTLKAPLDVIEAEDGLQAISVFREFTTPSIVLMDINMPKMDGFQASLEMRSIERKDDRGKSQIIAVTALAGADEKRRGLLECGMDSWLTKPCDKATIHKAIEGAQRELASPTSPTSSTPALSPPFKFDPHRTVGVAA